jgi:tetratricopeptide (TPR) repeat protein
VWRTGANASTKISFSEDVKLNGHEVPAGKYALYTIFNEQVATIILSKNLNWWGSIGYDENEDLLRFEVPVKHPSSHYETFTISFSDFTRNSANLNMKWEHTKAMFNIESEVDEIVVADIKKQVIDAVPDNPDIYFQAAAYYYDTERDSNLALQWVNKLIEMSENDRYWVIHLQAKLLARLGRNSEAIQSANKSISLAENVGNPDYVRLNQQLISSIKQ